MVGRIKPIKRKYSEEERQRLCRAYLESGLSQELYCREVGISKSALRKWRKQLNAKEEGNFVEVNLLRQPQLRGHHLLDIKIRLSNQMELLVPIEEGRLIPFIREICDATSTLR